MNLAVFMEATGSAVTEKGRYDARSVGKLLNWSLEEMAQYLGVSAQTIRKGSDARSHQAKLQELAGLYQRLVEGFFGVCLGERTGKERSHLSSTDRSLVKRASAHASAWLNTPIAALGGRPKDLILSGRLAVVRALVEDIIADAE
jgi:hypothetical protein